MSKDQSLTSVKLNTEMFDSFRIECVKSKFSFQKLSERAIHLFLTNPEFRKMILNHNDLSI